ncbi:hypothetical protein GRX66_18105 [Halobacterium sp. PCN9]|uniref:Uncharacterized protein n=1 Tax=Halobacterium bonnevillei TaxID=2692200 RepID=A0A6B0STN9_9EURY|nr:hypothetical protein [Halobacterium bonnevillei]
MDSLQRPTAEAADLDGDQWCRSCTSVLTRGPEPPSACHTDDDGELGVCYAPDGRGFHVDVDVCERGANGVYGGAVADDGDGHRDSSSNMATGWCENGKTVRDSGRGRTGRGARPAALREDGLSDVR